ncbi:DUF397 domain-containing protein [Streptomyces sp. NRRL F-5126]|uniref:DUF397 domain-containing protein n=1 Tax=Streptomyces sp. NRRL F-5126 TaxID=1463857 RepID=UPI0004C8C127|nr:DUF397 domain-containing protein [Streptomyces sp. NRRL F-5126]
MSSGTKQLIWFKSTYSGTQGDSCVEIAINERAVHVRDSKDSTGPSFTVGGQGWGHFVRFASKR